jgi:hypothetical protein
MIELTLDQELRALLQPLSVEELAHLEASLLAEGCRDPLVVWAGTDAPQVCAACQAEGREVHLKRLMGEEEDQSSSPYDTVVFECLECSSQCDRPWTLLDGHHRYPICQAHHLSFAVVEAPSWVKTRDDAKIWIIQHQFARRNLESFQRAELALMLEPMIAERAKRQQGARTDLPQNSAEGFQPIETREELAQRAGVSHDTIRKVKAILKGADEPTKDALRRGTRSIHAVHKTLPRRRPGPSATAAAAPAVPSPTPVHPMPLELPPQLRMAQRLIDLAAVMLEELATWRQQSPHDAVVHAFGRMETHLTEIKDYFGKKYQEMHASYATGDASETGARPTEDAKPGRSGDDHPDEQPPEGSEAPALAGAHGVAATSLVPGVSIQVIGDAEGTAPRPDDAAKAPAVGAARTCPSEPPDNTPPANTASHGTPGQGPPTARRPPASQASSEGVDRVRQALSGAGAEAPAGGSGATAGDVPDGSLRATAKRHRKTGSLRRQLFNILQKLLKQGCQPDERVQQLNDMGLPTPTGEGPWDAPTLEAFERHMGLRV